MDVDRRVQVDVIDGPINWTSPKRCGLSSLPSLPLPAHPLPDLRSIVQQLNALCLAGDEDAHYPNLQCRHGAQVEHGPRSVPPDLGLEFGQIVRHPDATDEPQRGGLAVGRCLDSKGHLWEPAAERGRRGAGAAPLPTTPMAGDWLSAVTPVDLRLPNGRRAANLAYSKREFVDVQGLDF